MTFLCVDLEPQVSDTKQLSFLIDSSDVTNFVYLQDYIFGAGATSAEDLLFLLETLKLEVRSFRGTWN